MSTIEIHLIEYRFRRGNPAASKKQVSEHVEEELLKSLVSNESSRLLLRDLSELVNSNGDLVVESASALSLETPSPGTETNASTGETSVPTAAPTAQTGAPTAETSAPTAETSVPTADTGAPASDTSVPGGEIPTSGSEANGSSGEIRTPAPGGETGIGASAGEVGTPAGEILPTQEEKNNFHFLAGGMLNASCSSRGEMFLRHVLDFCNENSQNQTECGGTRLWQHLRSVKDEDGFSPLHRAVILGRRQIVKLLVTPFCEIAARISERSAGDRSELSDIRIRVWPPGHALEFSDFDVLHARTPEGWTPLHFAAVVEHSDEPVVADSLCKPLVADDHEASEADKKLAKGPGKSDTLDVLLLMYNNINKPDEEIWDFADNYWMTPLHYAVLFNREANVRRLLTSRVYGRHVNAGDYHRKTALHMAVCHSKPFPLTETLQPSEILQSVLKRSTPLPSIEVIKTLVESSKVDLGAMDCCLYTPLLWAVHVGYTEAVKCLVSFSSRREIRATQQDVEGRNAMKLASKRNLAYKKATKSSHKWKYLNWRYFNWDVGTDTARKQSLDDFNTVAIDHLNDGVFPPEILKEIQFALLTCEEVQIDIQRLHKKKQHFLGLANAMIVAATLVAAASFQGTVQLPDPSESDDGYSKHFLPYYVFFNIFAFSFSIGALLSGITAAFSGGKNVYVETALEHLILGILVSGTLLHCSVGCFILAFALGTLASTRPAIYDEFSEKAWLFTRLGLLSVIYVPLVSGHYFLVSLFRKVGIPAYDGHAWVKPWRILGEFALQAGLQVTQKRKSLNQNFLEIRGKLKETWSGSWNRHDPDQIAEEIESVLGRVFGSEQVKSLVDRPEKELNQLQLLLKVYEEIRTEMHCRSSRSANNMRFLSDSGLKPREIHFWMTSCAVATCRVHSLQSDRRRWKSIAEKVETLLAKERSAR